MSAPAPIAAGGCRLILFPFEDAPNEGLINFAASGAHDQARLAEVVFALMALPLDVTAMGGPSELMRWATLVVNKMPTEDGTWLPVPASISTSPATTMRLTAGWVNGPELHTSWSGDAQSKEGWRQPYSQGVGFPGLLTEWQIAHGGYLPTTRAEEALLPFANLPAAFAAQLFESARRSLLSCSHLALLEMGVALVESLDDRMHSGPTAGP